MADQEAFLHTPLGAMCLKNTFQVSTRAVGTICLARKDFVVYLRHTTLICFLFSTNILSLTGQLFDDSTLQVLGT